MRLKTVFTILFCCSLYGLHAQTEVSISGHILDKADGLGLPFVTILLQVEGDSMVAGAISDDAGRFNITNVQVKGNCILVSSYIGYETVRTPFWVGEKNNHYDLGKINLSAVSTTLEDVVITAKKALVDAGLVKKTFNVADQIAQSGGSVLDAMKAMPGITVDQDGRVLLRGSDQVSVLVDGKQSGMTGFGTQQGLGNLPAANIDRIEIINNPSAKYDANGMAGIINIIYKKEKESGFNGDVGMTFGLGELTTRKEDLPTELGRYKVNPKFIPSTNFNYRTGKTNTFLQAEMIRQRKLPNNEFTTRMYDDGRSTISAVPENRTQTHFIVKAGTDWQLNEKNALGISAIWDREHHIDTAQIPFIDLSTNKRYRYWHWKEDEITGYLNFKLNYQHDFAEVGHRLNMDLQYARGWEDESYFLNDSSSIREGVDMTRLLATENTTSFTTDYVKPLKNGRVELGAKIQFRTIPVIYDILRGQETIIYEGIGDWSDWGENIYAGYINYLFEKRSFDIEGGLRVERTNVFYDIAPENIYYPENDAYNYFKLYPNIRVTLKINPSNNFSIFYNKRVDRPGEPNLRIFPKYDDPELLKVGSPYIRPQFTESVELAYKLIWETGSFYFATYYRDLKDPFLRIYSIDNSNARYNIINKIYQNVGGGSNLGIELLMSEKIGKHWNITGGLNWYNNTIESFSGTLYFPFERPFFVEKTSDQTWDVKLNNQISLPGKTQLQLTAIYMAPKNTPQGTLLARSSIDIGVKKSIFNNRGEFIFAFTDILNDFGIREEISGVDFNALYENYFETQIVTVGLKYKF